VRVERKTLIVAGFAAFLLAFCIATVFITQFAIEQRDVVAGFFAGAALMIGVYMLVW